MSLHKFECTNERPLESLTYTVDAVVCQDVVRAMYYYLLGCSYHKQNILDSMSAIAEEYEEKDDE